MYSPLCAETYSALNKNSNPRGGTRVSRAIVHHMAGRMTGMQCAQMHARGNNASAHYYIGYDGEIVGGVDETLRAWTTGGSIDYSAITMEVSNNVIGEPWSISDASYVSMINLLADIFSRYGIVSYFDGTKGSTLAYHQLYGATACPGTTLINAFKSGQIQNDVVKTMQPKPIEVALKTLYRVQVGAFSIKANAENYLKGLQSLGYKDAFIVEGVR